MPIRQTEGKTLRAIGCSGKSIDMDRIEIPFTELIIIIDVDFAILKEDVSSFQSNLDMIENGRDIPLQERYPHIVSLRQPLAFESFFFIYRSDLNSIQYVLYTEKDIRQIHRGFEQTSVQKTYDLLHTYSRRYLTKYNRK